MISRVPISRFVLAASTIGVVGSVTCLGLLMRSQYKVLKKPYCVQAFDILENNKIAVELIGPPIVKCRPEVIDKSQKFQPLLTDIKVPFMGAKQGGTLHIIANRASEQEEWNIQRLECSLANIPNKKLVVYKT